MDAVVHLAARVHVMNDLVADPLSAFRQVNVAGTDRLAWTAATNGVVVGSDLIAACRFYEKKTLRKIEEVRARLKSWVGFIGLIGLI